MQITHIIFDLGNVVLTNDWHYDCPEKFEAYSAFFHITHEDMERGWQVSWPLFCVGKTTEEEFWETFLQTAGANAINIEKAKELWRKYQQPIEGMLELLNKLRHSYQLFALTTISKEWLMYKTEKYQLDKLFCGIIGSGYAGVAKPLPVIYQLLVNATKTDPSKCLYIDDNADALTPAKDLGMQVLLFKNQATLEEQLREKEVRF